MEEDKGKDNISLLVEEKEKKKRKKETKDEGEIQVEKENAVLQNSSEEDLRDLGLGVKYIHLGTVL